LSFYELATTAAASHCWRWDTGGDGTWVWLGGVDLVQFRAPKATGDNGLSCYWEFALTATLQDVITLRMFIKVVPRCSA